MKWVYSIFLVVCFAGMGLYANYSKNIIEQQKQALETTLAENQQIKDDYEPRVLLETEDLEIARLTLLLMNQVNVKMSDARKQMVVQTVVRVTRNVLSTKEHREQFAVLLAIESKFNNKAKSPAGAVGVAQIMPQYAHEFAQICNINDYKKADLNDLELNMTIGACQFRALIESPVINGNVAAALVAYNAGKHSISFKNLTRLRNIDHPEPPNYVARFTFLSEEVKRLSETVELNKKGE